MLLVYRILDRTQEWKDHIRFLQECVIWTILDQFGLGAFFKRLSILPGGHARACLLPKIQYFDRKVVELRSWQHLIGLDELIILVYKKVDFGQKLTKLWPKNYTPKYGRDERLGLKMAIKCPNFNIFVWDKVYMLCTYKRNILCEYEVKWLKILDSKAKKPSKFDEITIS